MEHALYDVSPPPELQEIIRELNLVREWGFPNSGGRLDQPAWLIPRITEVGRIYTAFNSYRAHAGRTNKWAEANPGLSHIVDNLLLMRMKENGRKKQTNN